jgi:hypothetical protein
MPLEARWVHGNVFVPERIDDGFLARVGGIAWTDRVGLPRGWGRTYRGQNDRDNWFHAMIPTPPIDDGVRVRASVAFVLFDAEPDAEVQNVHVWDGVNLIFRNDNLRVSGNRCSSIQIGLNGFDIPNDPLVQWGVGISVRVRFNEEANITFCSAGVDFLSP